MRTNVPVVISKQSGVSEILHHALKIDFWDVDAMPMLFMALHIMMGCRKPLENMEKKEVENLKWENAAFHIKNVYESMLNKS